MRRPFTTVREIRVDPYRSYAHMFKMPRNKVKSRGGEDHSRGGGRGRTSNSRRRKIYHIRKQEFGAVGYILICPQTMCIVLGNDDFFIIHTGLIHLKTEFQALIVKKT